MITATMFALLALTAVRTVDPEDPVITPPSDTGEPIPCYTVDSGSSRTMVICDRNYLTLYCNVGESSLDDFTEIYGAGLSIPPMHIPRVITNCPAPKDSFLSVFKRLKVNAYRVTELVIESFYVLKAKHLEGLKIRTLYYGPPQWLILRPNRDAKLALPNHNFLDLVPTIRNLYANNVYLDPMPPSTTLELVSLNYATLWSYWGGCNNLKDFTLKECVIEVNLHLDKCTILRLLNITEMDEASINNTLAGVKTLESLTILDSNMTYMPWDAISENPGLRYLDIRGNLFSKTSMMAHARQLEVVKLSGNPLTDGEELIETISTLPALTTLVHDDFVGHCGVIRDIAITIDARTIPGDEAKESYELTCTVAFEPKDCKPVHVLQWYHIKNPDQVEPTYRNYIFSGTFSIKLLLVAKMEDNGTTVICRGITKHGSMSADIMLLVDDEEDAVIYINK